MSAVHTPGPWSVNWAGSGKDGKFVYDECYVYAPGSGVEDVAVAADIADPLTGKPSQANALLIASAPDLLNAVRIAKAHIDLYIEAGEYNQRDLLIAETMRMVIAKATGAQQ